MDINHPGEGAAKSQLEHHDEDRSDRGDGKSQEEEEEKEGGSSGNSSKGGGRGARAQKEQSEGALAEDENSSTSSSSERSDENANGSAGIVREIRGRKKPKSESSVFHDREKGISTCKHCGWIYPNPRPSAKMRREHRKHCGSFQSVHAWLGSEEDQEQGSEVTGEKKDLEVSESSPRDQEEEHTGIKAETMSNGRGGLEKVEENLDGEIQEEKVEPSNGQVLDPTISHEELGSAVKEVLEVLPVLHDHPVHDGDRLREKLKEAVDSTSEKKPELEYDLERILKEQTSHHLLCPNCGSCITRRVILKKRKRTSTGGVSLSADQAKAQKLEEAESVTLPPPPSTESPRGVALRDQEHEEEESEAWGCLACFSIFFRKARAFAVRDGLHEPLLGVRDRARQFSCLPYLLPDFHWDGTGSFRLQQSSEGPVASRGFGTCLPLEFPWSKETSKSQESREEESREVDIFIDLSRPEQTIVLPDHGTGHVSSESEQDKSERSCLPFLSSSRENRATTEPMEEGDAESFSCLPVLLPKYWDKDGDSMTIQEQDSGAAEVREEEDKGGFNCIPALLPSYSWGSSPLKKTLVKEDVKITVRTGEEAQDSNQAVSSLKITSQEEDVTDTQGSTHTSKVTEDLPEVRVVEPVTKTPEPQGSTSKDKKVPTDLSELESSDIAADSQADIPSTQPPASAPSETHVSYERVTSAEEKKTDSCDCLPWSFQREDVDIKAGLNCLPLLIPAYSWGADTKPEHQETKVASEEKPTNDLVIEDNSKLQSTAKTEDKVKDLTPRKDSAREESFISKETRIQAWIKTITNVVTVKSTAKKADTQVSTVQVDNATTFVDMTLSQKSDPAGKNDKTTTQTLVSTPSTGWALLDALERESPKDYQDAARSDRPTKVIIQEEEEEEEEDGDEEESLIDMRKQPATKVPQSEIQEVAPIPKKPKETSQVEELKQPLLTPELDVQEVVASLSDAAGILAPAAGPVTATVSVKSPEALIQVRGDDPKQAVETALSIAEVIPDPSHQQPGDPKIQEYVKSIVYGGLDVTLTSLAVVSSGAGSGTKTINVLALSLANLIAGLITLFHNIGSLYQNDYTSFEQYIGQSLWINGSISIASFLIFGCLAPLTYGFSFRASGDKDYKFAATAAVSLACLCLLGLGKAHVQKKSYAKTIVNLLLTGFVASVAGYFVGDYIKRWLQKMGLDDEVSPPSPPPPSSLPQPPPLGPFFLDRQRLRGIS
ncbi:hypothetical protein SELMODRAFT_439555 [Selaginella moellendorffii]|uniref:Membrane protein of ER body-like protein n=1 Tax=Selaginella moellendorffii TaxID=88036 RepID=D8R5X8_SELML|nr:hypothetical protein SELMODRAFT_439555 [Selaginella moellendorffii]